MNVLIGILSVVAVLIWGTAWLVYKFGVRSGQADFLNEYYRISTPLLPKDKDRRNDGVNEYERERPKPKLEFSLISRMYNERLIGDLAEGVNYTIWNEAERDAFEYEAERLLRNQDNLDGPT